MLKDVPSTLIPGTSASIGLEYDLVTIGTSTTTTAAATKDEEEEDKAAAAATTTTTITTSNAALPSSSPENGGGASISVALMKKGPNTHISSNAIDAKEGKNQVVVDLPVPSDVDTDEPVYIVATMTPQGKTWEDRLSEDRTYLVKLGGGGGGGGGSTSKRMRTNTV